MNFLKKLETILNEWLTNRRTSNSLLVLLLFTAGVMVQTGDTREHTETIKKSAHFQNPAHSDNSINVYNVSGSVSVEEHSGDAVEITAEKKIRAEHYKDLERGIEEMKFVVEEQSDFILVYLDSPFIQLNKRDRGINYNINTNRKEIGYDFQYDITMKVPRNTNVYASTINKGDVRIERIESQNITAVNVNGNVHLVDISGKTEATTVNGNIYASYKKSPDQHSSYKTVNGSIEVSYPDDISADLKFSSLRGDLYSDFENISRASASIETDVRRSGGTRYRINTSTPFRIGEGGPELSFRVLNGDVYIKKLKR